MDKVRKYDWGSELWLESSEDCPFLVKFLFVKKPLSLQIHPDCKPETLCALSNFTALIGFRYIEDIIKLYSCLDLPSMFKLHSYQEVMINTFNLYPSQLDAIFKSMPKGKPYNLCKQLLKLHPGDPATLAPLFLNIFELKKLNTIHIPPYTPHCYIKGTAIECQGNSDETIRIGLTSKHKNKLGFLQQTNYVRFD